LLNGSVRSRILRHDGDRARSRRRILRPQPLQPPVSILMVLLISSSVASRFSMMVPLKFSVLPASGWFVSTVTPSSSIFVTLAMN